MRRIFSKLAVLLIFIGVGYFIMEVFQHQLLSMSDRIVEKSQVHQAQRKQTAAQLKAETIFTEQQNAEQKLQMESFESARRRAFDDAYVTPEGCGTPQTEQRLTECTNHKMRAKRTFFTSYGQPPSGYSDTIEEIQYGEAE